jgi:ABC-type Fe3+-siderophore transport system permease subunit
MTYKANPIHEAADKVAEVTGVPKMMRIAREYQKTHRARRQVILPAIALIGSILCFVAVLFGYRHMEILSLWLFLPLALVARFFGPIRWSTSAIAYDEYEQMLIWRARSIGMGAALWLAIPGCIALHIYIWCCKITGPVCPRPCPKTCCLPPLGY